MGGIRIEGSSGNVADATSAGNLKVQLPTTISQMGGVRMFSEIDDGAITGVPNVKSPETTSDYRLRVGIDQVLDHQTWREATNPAAICKFYASRQGTMQIATGQSLGYLTIGSSGTLSASQWAVVSTKRSFPACGISTSIVCEQTFLVPSTIAGSTVIEFGLGARTTGTSSSMGYYFRITATGIIGVARSSSSEVTTANMLSITPNVWYNAVIVASDKEIQFWINDTAYVLPLTGNNASIAGTNPGVALHYFTAIAWTTTPASNQNAYFGGYSVYYSDVNQVIDAKTNLLLNGASLQPQPPFSSSASLVNYFSGQQPAAVTLTANTGPGTNNLGGLFTLPATITPGLSDYPLFSFQVPVTSGSNATYGHEKSLLVTGIRISELYVATALTGGPLVFQWGISFGGGSQISIASLNTTDSSWESQPNDKGMPLGFQSLAASAAVGTLTSAIDVSFADAPLVTHPGDRFKVILRVPSGTAITAGEIRGAVLIRGYWV